MLFSVQKIRKISIGCILLSMVSCSFLTEDTKAQNTVDTEEIQKDDYIVEPNYEHPKFKELEAAFAKQKHRFEIDRCEIKYNDQSFFIGDSYEKIIKIFGEPDEPPVYTLDKKSYSIKYKENKLLLRFLPGINILKSFNISMINYLGDKDKSYKIVKFRKVPYQLDMTLNEFITLSDLEHNTTLGHHSASFHILNEKKCIEKNIPDVKVIIGSRPSFKNTQVGGGHLTTTVKGDFNPELTGKIEDFSIVIKKNKLWQKNQ